jgi:hypothetical protein
MLPSPSSNLGGVWSWHIAVLVASIGPASRSSRPVTGGRATREGRRGHGNQGRSPARQTAAPGRHGRRSTDGYARRGGSGRGPFRGLRGRRRDPWVRGAPRGQRSGCGGHRAAGPVAGVCDDRHPSRAGPARGRSPSPATSSSTTTARGAGSGSWKRRCWLQAWFAGIRVSTGDPGRHPGLPGECAVTAGQRRLRRSLLP